MNKIENLEIIGASKYLADNELSDIVSISFSKLNKELSSNIEIKFVSKKEIQKLNKKHLGIDNPTDVISFPLNDIPGEKSLMGSIVICEDYMKEMGTTTEEIVKHGVLHLLGYDHEIDSMIWGDAAEQINHHMI